MGKFCALKACPNRDLRRVTREIRKYGFPQREDVKEKWVNFIRLCNHSPHYQPPMSSCTFLCTSHFEPDSFLPNGRLTKEAAPTIIPLYSAERALRWGLITKLSATEELAVINDFPAHIQKLSNSNLRGSACEEQLQTASNDDMGMNQNVITDSFMMPIDVIDDIAGPSGSKTDTSACQESECSVVQTPVQGEQVPDHASSTPSTPVHLEDHSHHVSSEPTASTSTSPSCPTPGTLDSRPSQSEGSVEMATPPKPLRKRKCFVGDLSPTDFATPRRRFESLQLVRKLDAEKSQRLKAVQRKLRRFQKKLESLQALAERLQEEKQAAVDTAKIIEAQSLQEYLDS